MQCIIIDRYERNDRFYRFNPIIVRRSLEAKISTVTYGPGAETSDTLRYHSVNACLLSFTLFFSFSLSLFLYLSLFPFLSFVFIHSSRFFNFQSLLETHTHACTRSRCIDLFIFFFLNPRTISLKASM